EFWSFGREEVIEFGIEYFVQAFS
ncbi:hypothetical protein Goarm_016715, partial [Gossypium armourianum]|nr:hypothetical protein [Gossypium armourianum]